MIGVVVVYRRSPPETEPFGMWLGWLAARMHVSRDTCASNQVKCLSNSQGASEVLPFIASDQHRFTKLIAESTLLQETPTDSKRQSEFEETLLLVDLQNGVISTSLEDAVSVLHWEDPPREHVFYAPLNKAALASKP